jgi:predicted amidophosphoribosyltransferase
VTGLWAALADLVLPASCAGCGQTGNKLTYEVCARCVSAVEALSAHPSWPTPAPAGLPPVHALGEYGGELREMIIEFKDRRRHRLARPLGALLAHVITRAVPGREPVLVLYVPDTPAAARERLGDHMRRLAVAAAERLNLIGRDALVGQPLLARPKADSVALGVAGRAEAARDAFAVNRSGLRLARQAATRRALVLLDDIVTTGTTLAAVAELLADEELEVSACAVLAATRRRLPA